MKTIKFCLVLVAISMSATVLFGQSKIDSKIFKALPQNVRISNEEQTYLIVTDYYNGDIFGNVYERMRIQGEYTNGLKNGKVKWNNVTMVTTNQPEAELPDGSPVAYMENFTYKPSEEMLNFEAFQGNEEFAIFAKNMVWDMLGLEGFAWDFWDSLKINQPYSASEYNGKVDLAGQGFFENKNIILTWTGITERDGELCATIEFRTLNNPLEVSEGNMKLKGRSHYWGNIWVSMEDRQLEGAELFEDVAMQMNQPGQPANQIVGVVREIQVIKQKGNK